MAKKHKHHPEDQTTSEPQRPDETDDDYRERLEREQEEREREERDRKDDEGESTGDEQTASPMPAEHAGDQGGHSAPKTFDTTAPGNEKASEVDPSVQDLPGQDQPLGHRTNIPSDHLTKP